MATPSVKQRVISLKRQGFDDTVIGAILGLSSDDVRSLLVEADPQVVLPGGGEVKVAQAVLGHDDIVALGDTAFPLLDAAEPGTLHVMVSAFLRTGAWDGEAWGPQTGYSGFDANAQLNIEDDEELEPVLTMLRQDSDSASSRPGRLFTSGQHFVQMQALSYVEATGIEPFAEVLAAGFAGGLQLRLHNQASDIEEGDPANRLVATVMYVAVNDIPT